MPTQPSAEARSRERQRVDWSQWSLVSGPWSLVSAARNRAQRGFALLITITLLAFVVILLLGLATYTRVETAIAGNTQRQAQARENALFALNVALGQLQRHAGPDKRVTATAGAFGGTGPTAHFTGVWPADAADDPDSDPLTPLTWLVSGNEILATPGDPTSNNPLAVTPATSLTAATAAELVGPRTSGTAREVLAPLVPITSAGVPGVAATAAATIGRYAWWVGDQGVKAPVAVADNSSAVTYAPYGDGAQQFDLGRRIRQQIALGAGAADASGSPLFEPRDANNAPLLAGQKIAATNQIAFLKTAANANVGLTRIRQNFHAWSPNNFAVLANTKLGGLREDLSLMPQRLGQAFSAWARYDRPIDVSMETPVPAEFVVGTDPPQPIPGYGSDPLRRRFFITHNVASGGLDGGIHPVLAFFGLSFSIRDGVPPDYEVSARCVVGLWNPFSSALVPPAGDNHRLELRITGLPVVRVQDSQGGDAFASLQDIMGNPLRFSLAWPVQPTREDEASWLPGRVYYWTAESNSEEPPSGNVMVFNERNSTFAGAGVVRPAGIAHRPAPANTKIYRQCSVSNGDNTTLRVELVRSGDQRLIATFESPRFRDFLTTPDVLETDHKYVDFAYVFRLPEPTEIPEGESATWLSAAGRDPRRAFLPGSAFVAGENGPQPELYGGWQVTGLSTAYPSRLLDRATDAHDYSKDVPVFELPRGPLLSMGALQHLIIPGARPFAVGNPWGSDTEVNGVPVRTLFDRFFLSGLLQDVVPTTNATGDLLVPNPLLKPLRKADSIKLTFDDIRNMVNPPSTTDADGNVIPGGPGSAFSSKFFLQSGAFNCNSTSAAAWAAVLRSMRFSAPDAFSYLAATTDTGTAPDDALKTRQSDEAQFFRFSHSAQETYEIDGIQDPRVALFRQGMRSLDAAQVTALAGRIVELIRTKHAAADGTGGPLRSLEEFLLPNPLFAGVDAEGNALAPRSLLEAAIADAGINAAIPEFSSQWLTQGDIMTALAPVLFPRSDTFVIRTYGEAVNPITGATEARAWCEAVVQRLPEYFEPSDPPETPPGTFSTPSNPEDASSAPTPAHQLNQTYGRRFKVVSFRWLTRSDI